MEAPIEAYVLTQQLIRHLDAVALMARTDVVLGIAAASVARTVLEIAVRVMWLLHPSAPFEREARWLELLHEEERLWERIAKLATKLGKPSGDFASMAQQIFGFRTDVRSKLPDQVTLPAKTPSMLDMLVEQRTEAIYIDYVRLSQYVHGGHYAGKVFRRGLGTSKEFREVVPIQLWASTIQICCWSFHSAHTTFMQCATDVPGGPTESAVNEFAERMSALRALNTLREP